MTFGIVVISFALMKLLYIEPG